MNVVQLLVAAVCAAGAASAAANGASNYGKDRLIADVEARAEATGAPAIVVRSVIVASGDGDRYDPAMPLMWTTRAGGSLLHMQAERLDALDDLARRNVSVIRESMRRVGTRSEKNTLRGVAPVKFFMRGLQGVCFAAYKSDLVEKRIVAMSSGPTPIGDLTTCELSAWALAAQGISLSPDPTDAATVILGAVD